MRLIHAIVILCLPLWLTACGKPAEFGVTDPNRAALVIRNTSSFGVVAVELRSGTSDGNLAIDTDKVREGVYSLPAGHYVMIVRYSDGGPVSEARGSLESMFEVEAGDTIQFTLEGGDLHPPGTDGIRFRPPLLTQESPQTNFWLAIGIGAFFLLWFAMKLAGKAQ